MCLFFFLTQITTLFLKSTTLVYEILLFKVAQEDILYHLNTLDADLTTSLTYYD